MKRKLFILALSLMILANYSFVQATANKEVPGDQDQTKEQIRLYDGDCINDCDGIPDRDRLHDGSCNPDCDGIPDRDRIMLNKDLIVKIQLKTMEKLTDKVKDNIHLYIHDGTC